MNLTSSVFKKVVIVILAMLIISNIYLAYKVHKIAQYMRYKPSIHVDSPQIDIDTLHDTVKNLTYEVKAKNENNSYDVVINFSLIKKEPNLVPIIRYRSGVEDWSYVNLTEIGDLQYTAKLNLYTGDYIYQVIQQYNDELMTVSRTENIKITPNCHADIKVMVDDMLNSSKRFIVEKFAYKINGKNIKQVTIKLLNEKNVIGEESKWVNGNTSYLKFDKGIYNQADSARIVLKLEYGGDIGYTIDLDDKSEWLISFR